jgi:hypothetical protein
MLLKNQVCSLELAIQMKGLGFEQESLWYWYVDNERDDTPVLNLDESKCFGVGFFTDKYSAFTVAELGERMHHLGVVERYYNVIQKWVLRLGLSNKRFEAKTEADARAMLLIDLRKWHDKKPRLGKQAAGQLLDGREHNELIWAD